MPFAHCRRVLLATIFVAAPLSAGAQGTRYESWSPPGTTSTQTTPASTENLLKDLKVLVDDAEKARAADRMFLRDLRDLMARYQRPWTQRLVFDDFIDGDVTRNPTWTTVSGEFWVEQGYGLRSKSVAGAPASGEANGGKISKEQLAISILGAVLQGTNKNTTNTAPAAAPAVEAKPAVLSTRARISNSFALSSSFSSWKGEGNFAYAVTQGTGSAGYRLVYNPKQTARGASLELVRVTSRGEGTIDSASINTLEDQKNHSLEWTRATDGQMIVSLDGKAILNARDASFRDPFDAVAIINAGADVIVKSVEVLGVK
ncbi:hypothetical protein [Magnetovibrio sp.]|uniref:hypothetical protein n=1 Tax=Magnetovibrio sp. TaxID=2024836 RepID=UPI002F942CAE